MAYWSSAAPRSARRTGPCGWPVGVERTAALPNRTASSSTSGSGSYWARRSRAPLSPAWIRAYSGWKDGHTVRPRRYSAIDSSSTARSQVRVNSSSREAARAHR
ncbi:hypothetical protein IHE55_21895 [Streptomyces pactum]|uniref:Uncharacterized protein n=1 Tax=Streptomyces pactum TaxID=68249 RepID=A0ABS0NPZ8_9ACTN|nr:hypothetical protein [Streptomyces pactum]MBH5337268.1 hypothetical protein [Streptomyces pactum]